MRFHHQQKAISFQPGNFFAKKENHENFALFILKHACDINIAKKGDPNNNEPDYYVDSKPLEITLAGKTLDGENLIRPIQLSNYSSKDAEGDLYSAIEEACARKEKKKYCDAKVTLCVLVPSVCLFWVYEIYGSQAALLFSQNKESLLTNLRQDYLQNNEFNNILIIFPGLCGDWITYDVKQGTHFSYYLNAEEVTSRNYPFTYDKEFFENEIKPLFEKK